MRLPEAFVDFHDAIELSPLSEERINTAWGRLHSYLCDAFGLPVHYVYIQGSYANDTAVKPADEDGEYDLDIVCLSGAGTPAEAIHKLTEVLGLDGDLAERIEPNESGRPCVRLRYADDPEGFGFHVDIVPAKGADPANVIEVPMRGHEGWRDSAPYLYTQWCQQQGEQFLRVIRFLKRWRDVHGDGSIASIVLQVLAANDLDRYATSDAEAVTGTLVSIRERLSGFPDGPPEILNPVLRTENLADRWTRENYEKFCRELDEAVALAEAALNEADEQAAHERWQALFGEDFPATPADVKTQATGGPPPPPDFRDERQQAPTDERYG
jgi:predicted nucleotidyltransferase